MFKSQEQLIAEIHNEFDTAQDRLLQEAKTLLESLNPDSKMVEVAYRLAKIGFTNTPTVKKAQDVKKQLVTSKEQAELIQHYKFTYPFLKFLTEEELNRICEKYELIHAPVGNYIKEVPEKNLRDIEIAQELKEDDMINRDEIRHERSINERLRHKDISTVDRYYLLAERGWSMNNPKLGLFIAAPKSHFDLKGVEKTSKYGWGKPEIKDPIVFRYVRGGVQVLTKWGLEGEDPSLVVEKFN